MKQRIFLTVFIGAVFFSGYACAMINTTPRSTRTMSLLEEQSKTITQQGELIAKQDEVVKISGQAIDRCSAVLQSSQDALAECTKHCKSK